MWRRRPIHHKVTRTPEAAGCERETLALVQGPGVVPLVPCDEAGDHDLRTPRGHGSLADVLAERRTLPECECRGVAIAVIETLSRVHALGVAHGDVKPANLVFDPDGGLWLIDFDAAGPVDSPRRRSTPGRLTDPNRLTASDDVVAVAVLAVECATGVVIDPVVSWPARSLATLGCPPGLAVDVESILVRPGPARAASALRRRPARLPRPAALVRGSDPTPTVDLGPVCAPAFSSADADARGRG